MRGPMTEPVPQDRGRREKPRERFVSSYKHRRRRERRRQGKGGALRRSHRDLGDIGLQHGCGGARSGRARERRPGGASH